MPPTFTLYGKKWRLPKPDFRQELASAGDNSLEVELGGKPWLLFSFQAVNRTTNNLKQHVKMIRVAGDPTRFPDDRYSLDQQKIQQNDDGTTWSFDPPKLITGNRLIGYFEDCVANDELIIQYVMAAEA